MRNNKKYSVVMFDFGGVIAEEGFVQGMKAIAEKHGLDPSSVEKTATAILYDSGYLCGKSTEEAFWESFKRKFDLNESVQDLRNEVLSRFVLRPWMLKLIHTLRDLGYATVLLTDQTNWIEEINEKASFYDIFDYVFNSYRLGKSKHDGTIFQDVLNTLHEDPGSIIFIDDKEENVTLAKKLGIVGILYKNKAKLLKDLCLILPELSRTSFD